ncbi:MAG TPA: hypothetical protein VMV27_08295 [Candidatus Binataceae bacterium]|nr:hypothetical protein [Candidatus Binataceae bacterium]
MVFSRTAGFGGRSFGKKLAFDFDCNTGYKYQPEALVNVTHEQVGPIDTLAGGARHDCQGPQRDEAVVAVATATSALQTAP